MVRRGDSFRNIKRFLTTPKLKKNNTNNNSVHPKHFWTQNRSHHQRRDAEEELILIQNELHNNDAHPYMIYNKHCNIP